MLTPKRTHKPPKPTQSEQDIPPWLHKLRDEEVHLGPVLGAGGPYAHPLQLRKRFEDLGQKVGPITNQTRTHVQKKYLKVRAATARACPGPSALS